MADPKFRIGQRVYVNANAFHGKVIFMSFWGDNYHYHLDLDLPNPLMQPVALYGEQGLSATLEEALAWRKEVDAKTRRTVLEK